MPIGKKSYPMRFSPKGLVDAFDSTDKFPGACVKLANLVFDPGNPEIVISRPGVTSLTTFGSFTVPAFVSVQCTVGDLVYGMIASNRNAGKDEPFCFDHAAGAFIAVAGVVAGNCPISPATAGAWTPPTMAVIGTKLIVTHPGFPGGATKFGYFDIANPAAPTWAAGDLATQPLPSVPVAVANYRNRAYFACGNTLPYTDVLDPLTRTLAAQTLTIGDTTGVLALAGLPVLTTSSGVVAALIVFKGFQTWQITGDTVTSDLAENFLSLSVGTLAPRSVAESPRGIYFASTSGPKMVDPYGQIKNVTHGGQELEADLVVPWQNMTTPSRVAAAYSDDIYRICMQTTIEGDVQTNDYWFDENKNRWTGPHSFAYDCAAQHDDHFILTSAANPAALFHSRAKPNTNTVYTDNSAAYTTIMKSSTFPKTGHMTMKQVVESTQELATGGGAATFALTALDDQDNTLNSCNVTVLPAGSTWGTGVWGAFVWAASKIKPSVYNVPWTAPLVFKKMALYNSAMASQQVLFGTFFARYQDCGYTNQK